MAQLFPRLYLLKQNYEHVTHEKKYSLRIALKDSGSFEFAGTIAKVAPAVNY